MKIATKPTHYPPHLRQVATLPWEIKNSNFLQKLFCLVIVIVIGDFLVVVIVYS